MSNDSYQLFRKRYGFAQILIVRLWKCIGLATGASSMQNYSVMQGSVRQRGGTLIQSLGFGTSVDDDVAGSSQSEQGAVGGLRALVGRQVGIGDDHQKVQVAVRAWRSPRVGAEQNDSFRVQSVHQPASGFFDSGGNIHRGNLQIVA